MKTPICLIACLFAGVLGCNNEGAPTSAATPAATPAVVPEATPKVAEVKPEYTLDIKVSDTNPKKYKVVWTATVNTGGWTMKTEQATVEDSMRKLTARVYVILERPNPKDMVTQALETLTGEYDAGETAVDNAELSVKQTTRGVKHDTPELYAIVKRAERKP